MVIVSVEPLLTALRVTLALGFEFGDSEYRGRVLFKIESLFMSGIGCFSHVSIEGRGVLCAVDGA